MAKKPNISTVNSGYQGTATLNSNFQNIRDQFDNTLSRDGSTPNAMLADLDMNGYAILNVGPGTSGGGLLTVDAADLRYVNQTGDTMTGSLTTPALYTNGLYINGNPVLPDTLTYNGIVKETITATSGQTVFNLTSISYTPGINNLSVYVDGVYQKPSNYTETNATRVTFSVGLHVGAIVDFVVLGINSLGGTADAVNLTYTAPGIGANTRTVYSKLSDVVSVKDFGAVGDGITDDTAAIQEAITASVVESQIVFMPAGTYLVTDTLNIPMYTQIKGEHSYQNGKGYNIEPLGTKISFQPTTAKTLFQASGTKLLGGFSRSSYLLEGLYLEGNSITSTGNSIYAIDADSIAYSTFRDITIQGFRTGIRTFATTNNRFENIHIANAYIQNVLYDGGTSTTDVWTQCTFHYAPIGVNFVGVTLGVRFTDCLFESLDNYGVNIAKESFAHSFVNCYAEDVPGTANANGTMFRVGHDGTTLTVSNALTVIGGYYGGRNAGGVGSFIDVDHASGIMVSNPIISRYTNGVKTSANTQIDCVVITGMQALSVTTNYTDLTKINGLYLHSQTGIAGAEHRLRTPIIFTDEIHSSRAAPNKNIVIGADDAAIFLATTGGQVGFYGTTPIAKPAITGSKGGNVALANLLTQLAALGLITDSTT